MLRIDILTAQCCLSPFDRDLLSLLSGSALDIDLLGGIIGIGAADELVRTGLVLCDFCHHGLAVPPFLQRNPERSG